MGKQTAQAKEVYCEWFMLEFPDLGEDRCNIVRNLSECFFRKLGFENVGKRNGPTVRPLATSSAKFEVKTAGWREAVGIFLEKRKSLEPE